MPILIIGSDGEFHRALRRVRELAGVSAETPRGLELAALERAIKEYRARLDGTPRAADG